MAATTARNRSGRPISTAKSRKVVERLQQKIEDGSFYEAHQTYKALYQRFCAQGNEEQALSLLLEGASTLLKHEQVGTGHGESCFPFYWALEFNYGTETLYNMPPGHWVLTQLATSCHKNAYRGGGNGSPLLQLPMTQLMTQLRNSPFCLFLFCPYQNSHPYQAMPQPMNAYQGFSLPGFQLFSP